MVKYLHSIEKMEPCEDIRVYLRNYNDVMTHVFWNYKTPKGSGREDFIIRNKESIVGWVDLVFPKIIEKCGYELVEL